MVAREGAAAVHGAAGAAGSAVACVVFQPLDVVKTRQQISRRAADAPRLYMHRVALAVVRAEGWLALWRGTMPTLYRTVPGAALYFPLLNGLQRGLARALPTEPAGSGRNVQNMVAGGTARAIAGAIMSPITLVKARFETGTFAYASTAHALVDIARNEGGPRGLFRGVWPTVIRDAPYSGIYVMLYEQLRSWAPAGSSVVVPASLINFGAGLSAAVLATLVTQPFDVVKTHVQVDPTGKSSFRSAIVAIGQRHGLAGYFRGAGPRIARKSLVTASTWTLYEEVHRRVQAWRR